MPKLLPTLYNADPDLVAIIADRWDVDLETLDRREAAEFLSGTMLDPDRAAAEWARLTDGERGALQTLLGAPDHKMPEAQFERLFGEIRQMGPGRREREKPHLNPISIAEALFYRGLIARAFDQSRTGVQPFIYVPPDLAAVLPVHETGFDLTASDEREAYIPDGLEPAQIEPATTALVDDLTTLLAYLQVKRVTVSKGSLAERIRRDLAPYWLGEHDPAAVALLISLAGGLGLVATEDRTFRPVPAQARRWLEETRPRQVRALAEAWRDSTLFNELWFTPGLEPEETGWRNDPLLARQTVLTFLEMVPPEGWWPVDELIALVKEEEPDFQRPAGDYDSWYIRDAATGEYLRGFESWDQVDGAVLRFILTGPMHWLGLVDRGDGEALCRLTAYGRALCGSADWPDPAEDRPRLTVQSEGTILVPRMASRYERFQLARITEWGPAGDPFEYRLSATGLQRAAEQDVPVDAIKAFLQRTSGERLPESVERLLDRWAQRGDAEVWLSRPVVLRTTAPEMLQSILETPELRRFLGAQLGPTAVIVREGQAQPLADALYQHGIMVDSDE